MAKPSWTEFWRTIFWMSSVTSIISTRPRVSTVWLMMGRTDISTLQGSQLNVRQLMWKFQHFQTESGYNLLHWCTGACDMSFGLLHLRQSSPAVFVGAVSPVADSTLVAIID